MSRVPALLLALAAGSSWADGIIDVVGSPDAAFSGTALFPNWVDAPTASFAILECADATCPACANHSFRGLTVLNYGSATGGAGGDITGLSFWIKCGTKTIDTGYLPMTFAGNWVVGGPAYPAWTWAGNEAFGADACNCGCEVALYVYADIASCPVDGATVALGPGYNPFVNPAWPGGLTDSCGFAGPWSAAQDLSPKTIRYAVKLADRDDAAPGDTVNYTIRYGRPGTGTLNWIQITDTQPPYTHLVSAAPAADAGWNPDPGPPSRMRWTTGSLPTAGGPTGEITYRVTVDWGNGEAFEPGSGDVAAPEGSFLFNSAQMAWDPVASCASGRVSNTTATTVRRYLFWKLGDNDLLFAPRVGLPDDEMIYSIFLKNASPSRTWWDVEIRDTVPSELDVWAPGYGFDDPCAGWTMTPGGCAAATPGRTTGAGATVLTWRLDLPPNMTLTVRWKARVRPSIAAGSTATNIAAVRARGRTGIIGGTGDAGAPRTFIHEALILLRTTYVSYVAHAAAQTQNYNCTGQHTFFISFYPLNKACDFALYKKWCCSAAPCEPACAAFAATGGVSPTINTYAGGCTGGPVPDWETGCKAERIPARFTPSVFSAAQFPALPFNFLHKMVSNAPVIWELSACFSGGHANTYAGTTSLTYAGYIAYTYTMVDAYPETVNNLYVVNTSAATPTTLHLFRWNAGLLEWDYVSTVDLYNESQWAYVPPADAHYRLVSSDARIIVHKAFPGGGAGLGDNGNFGCLAPNRENGNLVSSTAPATFYLWAGHLNSEDAAIIGNVGAAKATYEVWRYSPFDPTLPGASTSVTSDLVGSAGRWAKLATDTVDPGLAAPANPHVYGANYDNALFAIRYRLYKVVLQSGGPIQAYTGKDIMDLYSGGSVMHSSNPPGTQMGREFWVHISRPVNATCDGDWSIEAIDIFAPKQNMAVRAESSDGYSATYTSTGPDQCLAFKMISYPAAGARRNFRMSVLGTGNPGDAIGQYLSCYIGSKYYTAPFLQQGVHYDLLAPPIVFCGQPFWVTVVVVDAGGGTKTDYCGSSSFTSTDPGAKIEGSAMDGYNFAWSSAPGFGNCNNNGAFPDENGVRVFEVTGFNRLGPASLVASDVTDGTITGLTTVMVVCSDIKLTKEPRLAVLASADTVQFRICWSNYSSASAFSFTMTDAVPMGTTFFPEAGTWGLDCGNRNGLGLAVAYSTVASPGVPPPASFVAGNPVAATRWLRWTVPYAGVQTTGCACFRVTVN